MVWRYHDANMLRATLAPKDYAKANADDISEAIEKSVSGGTITFGAFVPLKGAPRGKWIEVEVGFYYELQPRKGMKVSPVFGVFATVYGKGISDEDTEQIHLLELDRFPGEGKAQRLTNECLLEAIKKAKTVAPEYKKLLDHCYQEIKDT